MVSTQPRALKGVWLTLPHLGGLFLQLSLWDLVQSSGPLPKAVMAILVVFSLFSWAVIFSKWAVFRRARSANRAFLRAFRKATTLDAIAAASEQFRRAPLVVVFDFGYSEVSRQMKSRGSVTNPLALERTLQLGMSEEITRLERNMSILATTATVSPFIGLFGTVWGIMDSFIGISKAHTTNLAVVAPGIAEALLATALGLVAAIPAVMIYNMLARSTAHYRALLGDASALVMALVSRDLERAKQPISEAAE